MFKFVVLFVVGVDAALDLTLFAHPSLVSANNVQPANATSESAFMLQGALIMSLGANVQCQDAFVARIQPKPTGFLVVFLAFMQSMALLVAFFRMPKKEFWDAVLCFWHDVYFGIPLLNTHFVQGLLSVLVNVSVILAFYHLGPAIVVTASSFQVALNLPVEQFLFGTVFSNTRWLCAFVITVCISLTGYRKVSNADAVEGGDRNVVTGTIATTVLIISMMGRNFNSQFADKDCKSGNVFSGLNGLYFVVFGIFFYAYQVHSGEDRGPSEVVQQILSDYTALAYLVCGSATDSANQAMFVALVDQIGSAKTGITSQVFKTSFYYVKTGWGYVFHGKDIDALETVAVTIIGLACAVFTFDGVPSTR